jgi:hypothetical protein
MSGCGGGGGGGGGNPAPPIAAQFAGNYKGAAYYTSGSLVGQTRFFDMVVNANGAISSPSGSFNTAIGSVKSDGDVDVNRGEQDGSLTTIKGQFTPEGIGLFRVANSGGLGIKAAVARLTGVTTTFNGNYFGTTLVRTGTGIGTTEVIAVSVATSGAATVILTNANGTSLRATGMANLTTGTLTATGPSGAGTITLTLQLSKTGQASGIFETANSRGTIALRKV